MSEWISVEDRLPFKPSDCKDGFDQVLLMVTDGRSICILDFSGGPLPKPWASFGHYGDFSHENITHWMPLPEPPCD